MDNQDDKGKFTPGNRANERHGGASGVKALQHGTEFTGLAAVEQRAVKADLDSQGRAYLVEEIAIRLHTCSRLYFGAISTVIEKAAENGGLAGLALAQLTAHVKTFGFLSNSAVRAWREVRAEQDSKPATDDYYEVVKDLELEA